MIEKMKSIKANFMLLFEELCGIILNVTVWHFQKRGGIPMNFDYKKLWKILIDRGMLKKDLKEQAKITSTTLAKMGKGEPVSMEVLGRICHALSVDIGDIVEFRDE